MPALNATVTKVTHTRIKSIKKRLELFSYADVIVRATIALEIILNGHDEGATFFRRNRDGSIKEIDFFKAEQIYINEK